MVKLTEHHFGTPPGSAATGFKPFATSSRVILWVSASHRAHLSSSLHQLPSDQIQVRQGKQGGQLRGIFGQTAVANLGKAKLALDQPERMLRPRPQLG